MSKRVVNLLHVEDKPLQRLVVQHHLGALDEFQFELESAESEEAAVARVKRGGIGLILLDYQLAEGNGLSCLKSIRQHDPTVPIIALSGVAAPETVADLLDLGADDYVSKETLTSELLARSIRAAIARVDAWKRHAATNLRGESTTTRARLERLFKRISRLVETEVLLQLGETEEAARRERIDRNAILSIIDEIARDFALKNASPRAAALVEPIYQAIAQELAARLDREPVPPYRSPPLRGQFASS